MSRLRLKDKTKAMGIHFSGIGFAIVVTELLNKAVLSYSSWQTAWLISSVLGIFLLGYAFYILDYDDPYQQNKAAKKTPFKINFFIAAIFMQIVSTLIPIYSNGIILNMLSAIFYGAAFIGLVALFLNLGGKISKENPTVMMGVLTCSYGIGQITAPLYAVALVERFQN
jgi:MFS family permease